MGNNLLDIENATIFHHYKTILNDVNLTLREGEFIYIIGKTGSGKSSLLRTIYSDIPLKMGTINFDNQNISQLSKAELPFLRRKIGIIFQDFQLFQDRNAYENIKFVSFLKYKNIMGTQFHPERSDGAIDNIIVNFLNNK